MSQELLKYDRIILTGFMGTGKSTVGRLLARRLSYHFVDVDALIVAREKLSICQIFASKGERYFRALESEVLQDVMQKRHLVVATGGGAVICEANRNLMRQSGLVVNLLASPAEIAQRLDHDTERPLLRQNNKLETISSLLEERECYYAAADIRIDTTGKSVDAIVQSIIAHGTRGEKV